MLLLIMQEAFEVDSNGAADIMISEFKQRDDETDLKYQACCDRRRGSEYHIISVGFTSKTCV